jgi:putative DNA primase/helicase
LALHLGFPAVSAADDKVTPLRPRRMAEGDLPPPPGEPELPTIRLVNGLLDKIATQGEQALIRSKSTIYQRGHSLVRPIRSEVPASRGRTTLAAGLSEIRTAAMIDRLCRIAKWERFDGRAKAWLRVDPPEKVANTILSRVGEWQFPPIAGVVTTPTLRPDGTLLTAPGYDPSTRLYHMLDDTLDISGFVPARPTRDDALRALADLQHLLKNFPVVNETDHAVALSALISPTVRGAVSQMPMHAVRASTPRTGKSYLIDVASAIATARPCPVATWVKEPKEADARLTGLLLAAFPLICLDNVNGELGSDLLCQAIERPLVQCRPLGTSDIVEIETRASIYATGNGLRVRGDMTGRTVIANLDAGMERPELRSFEFEPVETVLADRARYVGACLTIVLAHVIAGFPAESPPLASFEDWSKYVRRALIWLGCADPCASMEQAREDDPELSEMRELIDAWLNEFGPNVAHTTAEIIGMVGERFPEADDGSAGVYKFPRMREFLMRIATSRAGLDGMRIAAFLRAKDGKIVNSHKIRKAGLAGGGSVRWQLVKA